MSSLPVVSRTSGSASPELKPASLQSFQNVDDDEKRVAADANQLSGVAQALEYSPAELDVDVEAGGVGLPWVSKILVLAFVLLLTFGSNFAQSSLTPLKSTFKKELGINNAQYGVISSAVSLVNTVLPLISGVLIDYYGPNLGSLTASAFIFVGAALCALGASLDSYGLVVGGQIIFGFGSTSIEVCQNKWYAHFSKGTAGTAGFLGLISGLDIGLGRVWNVAGKAAAIPIAQGSGNWAWALWVPAIFCGFTLVLNVLYVWFDCRLPIKHRVLTGRRAATLAGLKAGPVGDVAKGRTSRFNFIGLFALPAAFWIIPLTQLLQSGAVGAYTSNLAEVVEITRGSTKLTAGYTAAIGQVIPIVGTPILGIFFDRFGRRMHFIALTAALWVLVFALLAYTNVHPLAPTILGSVALATNALPWSASIPLIVPQAYLGTAFGVFKSFNSGGSTIMDVAVGAIQDQADAKSKNQYDKVFGFLIALKAIDIFFGIGYHWLDRKYLGRVLYYSERRRAQNELETTAEERSQGLRRPIKTFTWIGIAILGAMIATSYTLFIYYAM